MKPPKAMKNEGDVKENVRRVFDEAIALYPGKLWFFMPPANGYGRAGIPDFVGTFKGHSFAIETKFGKGTLTPHQLIEMNLLTVAGAQTFIVRETSLEMFTISFLAWCALCS